LFQTGDVVYGEGKLRDFGMVFKPCFESLKNKKINFSPAILKLETLLFQNMFLLFHLILYSQSDFDSKKKWSKRKKNMPNMVNVLTFHTSYPLYSLSTYDKGQPVHADPAGEPRHAPVLRVQPEREGAAQLARHVPQSRAARLPRAEPRALRPPPRLTADQRRRRQRRRAPLQSLQKQGGPLCRRH